MTPGKAGGLSGEHLKGADNTVSRLKAAIRPRPTPPLPPGEGRGEGSVRTLAFMNYPLILGFGFLRRSTDYIHVVVAFSRREKGWGLLRCAVHSPP